MQKSYMVPQMEVVSFAVTDSIAFEYGYNVNIITPTSVTPPVGSN